MLINYYSIVLMFIVVQIESWYVFLQLTIILIKSTSGSRVVLDVDVIIVLSQKCILISLLR